MTPQAIVSAATVLMPVPFAEEIRLLTAAEPFGLWTMTEREPPPFWAFPWAGGQALARYVLDSPSLVAGRSVFDAASGSGLVAIAAAMAGARQVTAGDIDPNALAAIDANAAANAVSVTALAFDLAVDSVPDQQVVLAADVFYERAMADRALAFLRAAAGAGAYVLAADPGRAFLPGGSLVPLASYRVPVLAVLEDAGIKQVTIYRVAA